MEKLSDGAHQRRRDGSRIAASVKGTKDEEAGAERRRQQGQKFILLSDDRVLGN